MAFIVSRSSGFYLVHKVRKGDRWTNETICPLGATDSPTEALARYQRELRELTRRSDDIRAHPRASIHYGRYSPDELEIIRLQRECRRLDELIEKLQDYLATEGNDNG